MGIAIKQIRQALETQLNAIAGIPTIAWENVSFNPTPGTAWIRSRVMAVANRTAGVGVGSPDRMDGLMMLSLFYPPNTGPQACETVMGLIGEAFEKGTVLTASSQDVHIRYCEPLDTPGEDPDWYQRTMYIGWYAFVV